MKLEFVLEEKDDSILVKMIGSLGIYEAKELNKILTEVSSLENNIIIDLKDIIEFHSSAIQILFALKKFLKSKNKSLKLINHSYQVLQVFNLFGLVSIFEDKVHVSKEIKEKLKFSYGTKKSYELV